MCIREEVARALDFFRRHKVSPRAAHRWLEDTRPGYSDLIVGEERVQMSQEARAALAEQLHGLTMDGAL